MKPAKHSRSHGLFPRRSNRRPTQWKSFTHAAASWGNYEKQFKEQAAFFRSLNVLHGVFGDIDLEPHREWVVRVCRESGVTAHLPLWKGVRRTLVQEFIDTGFKALIVVVNTKKMPEKFRSFD